MIVFAERRRSNERSFIFQPDTQLAKKVIILFLCHIVLLCFFEKQKAGALFLFKKGTGL